MRAAIEAISQRYLRLVRRFADARHAVRPQASPAHASING